MKNKKTHASPEAAPKSSNNVAAQANSAKPDKAITLVAITPDGGTANLATVLFPKEDPSSTPKKTKLSTEEESSLERLEKVIESGLKTFVEVGAALYQIQSQRLYRQKHDSFESYLASRWNFKRAHAYRLISAYRALETIQDEDGKDLAESHVRQLVRLPEDQRTEALRRAKELRARRRAPPSTSSRPWTPCWASRRRSPPPVAPTKRRTPTTVVWRLKSRQLRRRLRRVVRLHPVNPQALRCSATRSWSTNSSPWCEGRVTCSPSRRT